MSMVTREIFTNLGFGLNHFRVYLQKFKQKSEKKKGKKREKGKGPRGQISAAAKKQPTAQLPPPPESVRSSFLFSLT
jgi:hypothetical protein